MKIISAIGSFKGSIDSIKINQTVKEFFEEKGFEVDAIPVADGGDGLLASLCFSMSGEYKEVETVNALGKKIISRIAVAGKTGIVETALASGLALLDEDELNPLKASTYGTGILIKKLADEGIESIILGIGGSATNDGGMGCLSALGFEFFDINRNLLVPCGESLQYVDGISDAKVSSAVRNLKIKIACDVTNPLLGEKGATYVYGRQKGANDEMLSVLEKGMKNYSLAVARFCGRNYSELQGAGAAGGLGYGLASLLGAKLEKGAMIVLDSAGYSDKLKSADLVITGEGRLDNQTAFGKLPQIVASKAKESGVNCIALCGDCTADNKAVEGMGISRIYRLLDYAPLEECMNNTEEIIRIALGKACQ